MIKYKMIFKRNILWVLTLICGFCWVGARCQPAVVFTNITRCDQLPRVQLRSPSVALTSPFHVYRSNIKGDNCTTGVVTGPGPTANQNLTFILLQKTGLKSIYSVQPGPDDLSTYLTECGNAAVTYHYYSFLFQISNTTYVNCPYSCDKNGLALDVFRCYGHTVEDEAIIQRAIDQYMTKVPGYDDVFDAQTGCQYDSFCSDYF